MVAPALTLPQWYPFQKSVPLNGSTLQTPTNWDAVRTSAAAGDFGFGASREEWMARAKSSSGMRQRAEIIASWIRLWKTQRVVSVGVGTGLLEFLIAGLLPGVSLRCGDYATVSLELLRQWFLECQSIEVMDLRAPTWASDPGAVVLLNRVDTEMGDQEWRQTFADMARRGVERIIFVPCGLLSWQQVVQQVHAVGVALRSKNSLVRAGYLRTERRMLQLCAPYNRDTVAVADLPVWSLTKRR
jgi:hypothetical protein